LFLTINNFILNRPTVVEEDIAKTENSVTSEVIEPEPKVSSLETVILPSFDFPAGKFMTLKGTFFSFILFYFDLRILSRL